MSTETLPDLDGGAMADLDTPLFDEQVSVPDVEGKTFDPDAPYGYKADGKTPRISNRGPRPGYLNKGKPGSPKKTAPPPRKVARTNGPAARASGGGQRDYRGALMSVLQVPMIALTMLSPRKPSLAADVDTLVVYGPPLDDAVNDYAQQNAKFAALLDRVLAVTPIAPIVTLVASMAIQIAANHNQLPPGMPGAMSPEDLREAAMSVAGQTAA